MTTFSIEMPQTGAAVIAGTEAHFRVGRGGSEASRRTYYDTFDWRIYRHGGALTAVARDEGWLLQWHRLDGRLRGRSAVERVPEFAGDLPAALASDLGRVIGVRRLLPVVRVDFREERYNLLDSREKTVAWFRLEHAAAAAGDRDAPMRSLPERLRVTGVRGFDLQLKALIRFLDTQQGLRREAGDELTQLLAAVGGQPCSYSSRLRLDLAPEMPAHEAGRAILRRLFATMRANEEGTCKALDTEFLHDFRVAVRRTRSCLGQLKGVFPKTAAERFAREFAWLGKLTGPKRDLDVYLLNMDDYRAELPSSLREDLEPLEARLRERQHAEQIRLGQELVSDRYRELIQAWPQFLDAGNPETDEAPNGSDPALEVATDRIQRAYRRVCRRGRDIDEATPIEAIHRLRIDCKKLRYLLEFFRSLFPEDEIVPLIRALKRLQDDLGQFNDLGLQRDQLRATAGEMSECTGATAGTLLAMGVLYGRLTDRGQALRGRLEGSVARFVGRDLSDRFERLMR